MKIIINRSDETLDSVLTVSMAKMIKDKYLDASIIVLASSKNAHLFKFSPFIDEVYEYDRSQSLFTKLKDLWFFFSRIKPDFYMYVGGGFSPNFISWLKQLPYRGGLKSKWHTYLFLNKGVRQSRSLVSMHEVEYILNLLEPMGLIYYYEHLERYVPEVQFNTDEVAIFEESFASDLLGLNYPTDLKNIMIYPGMQGTSLNWTPLQYARFIKYFEEKYRNKFLYIIPYTNKDRHTVIDLKKNIIAEISEDVQSRIFLFDLEAKGLRYLMYLMIKSEVYLGANTGLTHVAAAANTKVIALFSPIKTQSAARWRPMSKNQDNIVTIVPDVICGESHTCALRHCPYYECMSKIEVEDVVVEAIKLLEK